MDIIVVHAAAGYATQHAVNNWPESVASAQWIIPGEDEPQHGHFVWATVAESKAAYHIRDSISVNDTVLGSDPLVVATTLKYEQRARFKWLNTLYFRS